MAFKHVSESQKRGRKHGCGPPFEINIPSIPPQKDTHKKDARGTHFERSLLSGILLFVLHVAVGENQWDPILRVFGAPPI